MRSSTNNPRVSPAQYTATPATTCTVASTCDAEEESSIYARAWRFVQRRLHLRPRASSCPVGMETAKTVEDPQNTQTNVVGSSSFCSDWQRVYMLKELEEAGARAQWRRQLQIKESAEWAPMDVLEQPTFRTQAQRKTAQMTCYNCGLLFFRPMSVASDTSAFCGRDCQSTFKYRRDLQDAVNECETFRSTVNWTRSNML